VTPKSSLQPRRGLPDGRCLRRASFGDPNWDSWRRESREQGVAMRTPRVHTSCPARRLQPGAAGRLSYPRRRSVGRPRLGPASERGAALTCCRVPGSIPSCWRQTFSAAFLEPHVYFPSSVSPISRPATPLMRGSGRTVRCAKQAAEGRGARKGRKGWRAGADSFQAARHATSRCRHPVS
jgi:hypothetical protein